MKLRGQHGYAMAALLVALAVMAIMMTAVMPTWRQMVRRDREAELVFRGQQYARAIGLFQRKAGPGVLPPNLDVLVDQKFLRKKYKDPITGDDFDLLRAGAPAAPGVQPGGARGGPAPNPPAASTGGLSAAGAPTGGIMGVASKSKEESIRVFNGRTHYNEWQFVFVPQVQQAGQGGGVAGRGGPQGGAQGGPQQRGAPPGGFPGVGGGDGRRGVPPGGGRGGLPPPGTLQPPPRR